MISAKSEPGKISLKHLLAVLILATVPCEVMFSKVFSGTCKAVHEDLKLLLLLLFYGRS